MSSILVSHPHVAPVSAGVAKSLAREGMLAGFFTGVAVTGRGWRGDLVNRIAGRRPVVRNRVVEGVAPDLLHAMPLVELGARAASPLARRLGFELNVYDALFAAHDFAVSRMPWPSTTGGVYAYEDGALHSFRRARDRGLERIWDLPSPHYLTVEDTMHAERARWPGAAITKTHLEPPWKRSRKDGEAALATTISVASSFTKKSLERVETSAPIVVIPYGFPVDAFSARRAPPSGPFTVLSVGSHDLRKGTPYLLEAWKRAAIPNAELHLVGPLRLSEAFLAAHRGAFKHWPHVPRRELEAHYAAADLLVFPTLADGFGLVIQEAMCCATPVLTTSCGGGPECVTEGVNGWIVPPRDIDALVDRLRDAADDRDRLFAMGKRARARAEAWTWSDVGRALVTTLKRVV